MHMSINCHLLTPRFANSCSRS